MRLKPGVKLQNLRPQIVLAAMIVRDVYAKHGLDLRITSANDGKHKDTSLHYAGHAVDLGTKYDTGIQYPQHLRDVVIADLRAALGADFDVVDEPDHIHVEYDPK